MTPLRIFIGYDPRETVAYHVLVHSILRHASAPVAITPLVRRHLREYTRERTPQESTDFSLTRFLVPWLCAYEGVAIFMDCDMLVRADLWELPLPWDHAVNVVQHDYVPRNSVKFLGHEQAAYPRKNWSSLMVFNNSRCTQLTPEYVNTAPPSALHRFEWADSVGELLLEWNHLVGEDNQCPIEDAKVLHWTNGGPWFRGYEAAPVAEEWFRERNALLEPCGVLVKNVERCG